MSDYTAEDINNAILTGIVKTLQIMKDVKAQGDDLHEIDFDEIIEMRLRDMTDTHIFDEIEARKIRGRSGVVMTLGGKTITLADGSEKRLSAWLKESKAGATYMSGTMSDPYNGSKTNNQSSQEVPVAKVEDMKDDIPF